MKNVYSLLSKLIITIAATMIYLLHSGCSYEVAELLRNLNSEERLLWETLHNNGIVVEEAYRYAEDTMTILLDHEVEDEEYPTLSKENISRIINTEASNHNTHIKEENNIHRVTLTIRKQSNCQKKNDEIRKRLYKCIEILCDFHISTLVLHNINITIPDTKLELAQETIKKMHVKDLNIDNIGESVCKYIVLHIENDPSGECLDRTVDIKSPEPISFAKEFIEYDKMGIFNAINLRVSWDTQLAPCQYIKIFLEFAMHCRQNGVDCIKMLDDISKHLNQEISFQSKKYKNKSTQENTLCIVYLMISEYLWKSFLEYNQNYNMAIFNLQMSIYPTPTLTYDSIIQTHKALNSPQRLTSIDIWYITLNILPKSFSEVYLIRELACVERFSFLWLCYCMPIPKKLYIYIKNIPPSIKNMLPNTDIFEEITKHIRIAFLSPKHTHNRNTSIKNITMSLYTGCPKSGSSNWIQTRSYQESRSSTHSQGHSADFLFSRNLSPIPNIPTITNSLPTTSNPSQDAITQALLTLLNCGHAVSIPTDKIPEYAFKIPTHEDNTDIQVICKVLSQFAEEELLATEIYCPQCKTKKIVSSFKYATDTPKELITSEHQHYPKGLEGYEFEHITIQQLKTTSLESSTHNTLFEPSFIELLSLYANINM